MKTSDVEATVVSVISGDGGARYLVKMRDDQTHLIVGPTLPLYPRGLTVTLVRQEWSDGTVKLSFKK